MNTSANQVGGTGAEVTLGLAAGANVTSPTASANNPILVRVQGGFLPNNSNVTFTALDINSTINQLGTSVGGCFGINVHPVLTANAGGYKSYATNVNSPGLAFAGTGTGKSQFGGDLVLSPGVGLDYSTSGGGALTGTATLSSGTVTVSTTAIKATDIIILSLNTRIGSTSSYGAPVGSVVAATSFVINAYSAGTTTINTSDNSTVNWLLVHSH